MSAAPANVLYPDREFTEMRQPILQGIRYSWFWQKPDCSIRLTITNPTPEQLASVRRHLNVKEEE